MSDKMQEDIMSLRKENFKLVDSNNEFLDLVRRNQRKQEIFLDQLTKISELEDLFINTCQKYYLDLVALFYKVIIDKDNHILILQNNDITKHQLVLDIIDSVLYIGLNAPTRTPQVKIPFNQNWSQSKLTITFKNAIRALVAQTLK